MILLVRMCGPEGTARKWRLCTPLTSAHALDGTLTWLLGHADEYLEKPVRVDTLIATATALIGQGRRPATDAGL